MEDENPVTPPWLRIWQQNTHKSLDTQTDLLISLRKDFEICMVQEPYIDFKGKTRVNPHWLPIYPIKHNENPKNTRSIIMVNRLVTSDSWIVFEG
jgi:hypothetical protein